MKSRERNRYDRGCGECYSASQRLALKVLLSLKGIASEDEPDLLPLAIREGTIQAAIREAASTARFRPSALAQYSAASA